MAILGQNQSAFAQYVIWFGNCGNSTEDTFDLTSSDKILSASELTQNGSNVRVYHTGLPPMVWDFTELKTGHAYYITLEKGSGHVEVPNCTVSFFELTDKNYTTSECGEFPTPTPKPEVEDCCENYDNKIVVTKQMAASTDTEPYTSVGLSVSGFQEGGTLCFDNLNEDKAVPGKIYGVSNEEFTLGGQFNTDYEITNRKIRYTDTEGECWEAMLEDSPEQGYCVLTKADGNFLGADDSEPVDDSDLTDASVILVRKLFSTNETLVINDNTLSELKKEDIVRIEEDNGEDCWELIDASTEQTQSFHGKITEFCTDSDATPTPTPEKTPTPTPTPEKTPTPTPEKTPTPTPTPVPTPTPTPTPTPCNVIIDYKFLVSPGVYENRTHISSGESSSINFDVSSSTVGLMDGLPTHIDNGGPNRGLVTTQFSIINDELHLTAMKLGGDWIYGRDDLMQPGRDPQHGGYNDQGPQAGQNPRYSNKNGYWVYGAYVGDNQWGINFTLWDANDDPMSIRPNHTMNSLKTATWYSNTNTYIKEARLRGTTEDLTISSIKATGASGVSGPFTINTTIEIPDEALCPTPTPTPSPNNDVVNTSFSDSLDSIGTRGVLYTNQFGVLKHIEYDSDWSEDGQWVWQESTGEIKMLIKATENTNNYWRHDNFYFYEDHVKFTADTTNEISLNLKLNTTGNHPNNDYEPHLCIKQNHTIWSLGMGQEGADLNIDTTNVIVDPSMFIRRIGDASLDFTSGNQYEVGIMLAQSITGKSHTLVVINNMELSFNADSQKVEIT